MLWKVLVGEGAGFFIDSNHTITSPVGVVEVTGVTNDAEGVVEVVVYDAPACSVRERALQLLRACICPTQQLGEGVEREAVGQPDVRVHQHPPVGSTDGGSFDFWCFSIPIRPVKVASDGVHGDGPRVDEVGVEEHPSLRAVQLRSLDLIQAAVSPEHGSAEVVHCQPLGADEPRVDNGLWLSAWLQACPADGSARHVSPIDCLLPAVVINPYHDGALGCKRQW